MPATVGPVVGAGTMSSVEQPALDVGQGLLLRPFLDGDIAAVCAAFADPDIQHWHSFRIDSDDEAMAWIEQRRAAWREETGVEWAIVDESGAVVGRVGLHLDVQRGNAEIAYWLLPHTRGRGVATRAVGAVTSWTHEWLGLPRILLQHSTQNTASCGVAMRSGYLVEGTHLHQDLHVDGWHDMHIHAHVVPVATL
jgi:[ribosomal protein S5]-alanine N-acetyltransferase